MKSKVSDIKHIWWDLDGTLYKMPKDFEALKYQRRFELYSKIVGKPITDDLKEEYMSLYKEYGSHSAVFVALGKPKDFWQIEHQNIDLIPHLKPDAKTVAMFEKFKILNLLHSIFTNRKPDYISKILRHLQIDEGLFTNFLTNDDLVHPKPHIEGFEKMIELSRLEPTQILYVGDRLETDIIPAKSVGLQTALVWSNEVETVVDYTFGHVSDVISLFT